MKFRVAIDGTHCTGKTTILKALKEHYQKNLLFEEVATQVAPQFNLSTPSDWEKLFLNRSRYIDFMKSLINRQVKNEITKKFIVDGSLYRLLAYARVTGLPIPDKNFVAHAKYDAIFYCPVEFPFVADGFRYEMHREEVDLELRKILKKYYRGKLIELSGTVKKRLDKITLILSNPNQL